MPTDKHKFWLTVWLDKTKNRYLQKLSLHCHGLSFAVIISIFGEHKELANGGSGIVFEQIPVMFCMRT